MAQTQRSSSILSFLGEEIIRIITPVSICMLMVVVLVSILNDDSSLSSPSSITTMAYTETSSDSSWDKFIGAFLNSLVFVAVVTVVTFVLVLLFYFRCTRFLRVYMGFSAFIVLGFMGGEIALILLQKYRIPIDCVTFSVVLFNSAVVGVLAVFMSKIAIFVTQSYLVVIGMLVAYWFTLLPEWTTWALLIAMALYDLAAVLLPVGPLRILVELAISRDEDIPALVYEARPIVNPHSSHGVLQRRLWREQIRTQNDSVESQTNHNHDSRLAIVEEGNSEISAPLIERRTMMNTEGEAFVVETENSILEGIGLGSSGAIKLGLGDFIFYSVLVGRAAMYDMMTVYACYLAIIAGLGVTLMLLAFYQKALPALPVSIALGVLFYFLTRFLLENFVVQCSLNLVMF